MKATVVLAFGLIAACATAANHTRRQPSRVPDEPASSAAPVAAQGDTTGSTAGEPAATSASDSAPTEAERAGCHAAREKLDAAVEAAAAGCSSDDDCEAFQTCHAVVKPNTARLWKMHGEAMDACRGVTGGVSAENHVRNPTTPAANAGVAGSGRGLGAPRGSRRIGAPLDSRVLHLAQGRLGRRVRVGDLEAGALLGVVRPQRLEPALGLFLEIVERGGGGEPSAHGTPSFRRAWVRKHRPEEGSGTASITGWKQVPCRGQEAPQRALRGRCHAVLRASTRARGRRVGI